MNRSIHQWLIGTMVIWAFISSVLAEGLEVRPWPNKLLYDPGETACFQITVVNGLPTAFEGKLSVKVIWEMEDTKVLSEQPVKLKAGETNVVEVKWEKIPEVLGCEVRADLASADGKVTAKGSEYFNVCAHMDMLRVGIHGGGAIGLMTYSKPEFLETIRTKTMPLHKKHYVNIGEYFVGKSHVWNLAPEEDEYPGGAYWESNTAVKTGIEEGHKYGIKSVIYVTSYSTHGLDDLEISLEHPEWLVYNKYGQPDNCGVNVKREETVRFPQYGVGPQPGCFCSCNYNWLNKEALDYHIDQLIANHKLVGMDGIRYDGEPCSPFVYHLGMLTVEGRKVMPDEETLAKERVRIVRYIRERVRKEIPTYLFMFNSGEAVGVHMPIDVENGVLHPSNKPIVEGGGALCNEEIRGAMSAANRFNNWKLYADVVVSDVDLTRAGGGYAYCLYPWPSTIHKNAEEIGYSLMLAAGDHPWFASTYDDKADGLGGSHYPIQKELFAFATRFSAMIWGRGIERIKKASEVVEVSAPTGVIWWKNFVHQRTLADGRKYVTVHLLNAPPNKGMGVVEQPLPEPIKNVQVLFKVPVKKVWIATARPGPAKVITLTKEEMSGENWRRAPSHEEYGPLKYSPVALEGGKLIVPELRMWTMIVAETGK
ncbi:MAG: hypothetical protein L6437_11990 [Kiritimatiellae bacterium]|nr:hypothetical protein [Kiritimatiellia bacterium]